MFTRPERRPGRMMRGRRTRRERKVERLIVPKRAPVAWAREARTTCWLVGCGTARRWKYHWLTVAAVVARCTPAITPRVQRYCRMKKTPSHQELA